MIKQLLPLLTACWFITPILTHASVLQEIPPWHFTPPENSGVINVKDYGAKGDGVTDDTAAINRAVSENIDISRYRSNPFIWFPDGTYLVSGPIESRIVNEKVAKNEEWSAGWRSMMILVGESRAGTIIRLADKSPGYQDSAQKKWLIATGSEGDKRDNQRGGGNRAFRHSVMNMTVDVGNGNPGAVGIDFISNNRGTVAHVTIRAGEGSGHTALDLTRHWPGPAMIFDVKIEGFDTGIALVHYQYGMTFENIHMTGQRTVGIRNKHNVLAMRRVLFEGSVPFYNSGDSGHAMIALLDSHLKGTDTADQAALNSKGMVNLRRVTVEGFGTVLHDARKDGKSLEASKSGPTVVASHDQGTTYNNNNRGTTASPLDLPIEDVPIIRAPKDAKWVDGGDTGESLQAAIDAGAEYIYIRPTRPVELKAPVILRNNVRLIQGLSGHLEGPKDGPAVIVEDGTAPIVAMHQMYLSKGVVQKSKRTFALVHGDLGSHGIKATGSGKTHIMDIIGRGYDIGAGHKFWARQLNAEFGPDPLFTNSGGDSWILGFKMETSPSGSKDAPNSTPSLRNRSGNLEVLGGLLYTLGSRPQHAPLVPAFINERGRLSVSYRTNGRPETWYKTILRTGGFERGTDLPASAIGGNGAALLTDQR